MAAIAANPIRHRITPRQLARPLIVLLLIGAALVYWQTRPTTGPGGSLVASGTIESEETNVAVELAGRVISLPVAEGDAVKRGDVLLRLDDSIAQAQLAQGRAAVDVARANLLLVEAGARTEEIRIAEAAVAQAAAGRAGAERALASALALRSNPQELAVRIGQAESAVRATQARLDQVAAGARGGDLAAARNAREQARGALTQLEATTTAQERVAREALVAAESRRQLLSQGARAEDVRAAELALEQARNTLWSTQIDRDAVCGRGAGALCDGGKARVAAAETAVTAAANGLEKVRNGSLPDEIRIAETAVQQAQADLAVRLANAGPALVSARSALGSAEGRVQDVQAGATTEERAVAESGLEQARRSLADLVAIREQPLAANAQVDAAQGALDAARAAELGAQARLDQLRKGPTEQQVGVARAAVSQAEASAAVLTVQNNRTTVLAPSDGVVTRRSVRIGEAVAPGIPLLALAPLEQLNLTVYVPEDRIGRVVLSGAVDVRVDSFPGEVFLGAVTFIAPRAEFTPRNVQTQSDRAKTVFAVRVRIPNADGRLKPGMFADATLAS